MKKKEIADRQEPAPTNLWIVSGKTKGKVFSAGKFARSRKNGRKTKEPRKKEKKGKKRGRETPKKRQTDRPENGLTNTPK